MAKFMHVFCTIVRPIELMEREGRDGGALVVMDALRGGHVGT